MVTLQMIQEAQESLKGIARKTPLENANRLGENIYIKSENLQLTGAFKIRGAYNKIRSLTPEEASHGVIACSAGNHAQGIALSATKLGIKSVICMPEGAPISKVEATRNYGAEVVLVPGVYDDAAREAERLSKEHGYTFAHPFNDPYVIAGQGTIGLEILEQSDVMLVCGNKLSNGMRGEIAKAALLRMPITVFEEGLYLEVQKLVTQNNGNKKSVKLDRENFPMAFTDPESYLENAALFK